MLAAWQTLFSNAAFAAAVVTAIVSVAGWFGTRLYAAVQAGIKAREKKRIAIVRFYADVRLRAEGLAGLLDPSAVDALAQIIHAHQSAGQPFRIYGTQVSDGSSQERMNVYLHEFSSDDAYTIRRYILFDRMLVAQYDKLQSDSFEALSADRKIAALTDCGRTARELKTFAEQLQATIEAWPALGR